MSNPYKTGLTQNPSPTREEGHDFEKKVQEEAEYIMKRFLVMLPSNYVSQKTGPFYTLQFKSMAEALARVQISIQQLGLDSSYAHTRPELMWQILGSMVFPKVTENSMQPPIVDGDVQYRDFLRQMVVLLLQGSTKNSVERGAGLLTDADVTVVEKSIASYIENSAWTIEDQFMFEVNVEKNGGTAFPDKPFDLLYNVSLILDALKPAHTLFEYRHVFREVFGVFFQEEMFLHQDIYYYDDLRKFCLGLKNIFGNGYILSNRQYLSDPQRSFSSVLTGSTLYIGDSSYEVVSTHAFIGGDDTPRHYVTSPTGLEGLASVEGDVLTDPCQDWSLAVEGEILTFQEGLNTQASYRLQDVLGASGGSVGFVSSGGTQVRVSPSIVKVRTRLPVSVGTVSYKISLDRLGVQEVKVVSGEDVSTQCYL